MAYRDKVIAESEGEAARFVSVLAAYQQAPDVTRERLYLETMEKVLGDNSKVLIDAPQGNTMMYLPLDQMLKGRSAPAPAAAAPPAGATRSRRGSGPTRRCPRPPGRVPRGQLRGAGLHLTTRVGQSLGRNPFPLIVPCHRVLAAAGRPGGLKMSS